jgi:protein TonB
VKSQRQSPVEHGISAVEPYAFPADPARDDSTSSGARFSPPAPVPSRLKSGGHESQPTDQVVRADSALDLVLEQIVYQARVSTCATGAFIGLLRGGRMVYCAINGATAAEVVAYLQRDPRMVDGCLRTSSIQLCRNSDNCSDLDASVCRSLGAGSVLLVPVLKETQEKLGVLGVFAPQADAFATVALVAIESLSRRVGDTVAQMDRLASDSVATARVPTQELSKKPLRSRGEYVKAEVIRLSAGARGSLGTALMAGALLLVGWALMRSDARERLRRPSGRTSAVAVPQASATTEVSSVPAPPVVHPVAPPVVVPVPAKALNPVPVRAKHHLPDLQIEATHGGEAPGIVVFGSETKPTSRTSNASSVTSTSPPSPPVIIREQAALEQVVDRVEPKYPDEAKAHHVQGTVVLDVLVGRDGRVQRMGRVQGDVGLIAAASDAVRQWRFKPVIRNGHSASFETNITLIFALP